MLPLLTFNCFVRPLPCASAELLYVPHHVQLVTSVRLHSCNRSGFVRQVMPLLCILFFIKSYLPLFRRPHQSCLRQQALLGTALRVIDADQSITLLGSSGTACQCATYFLLSARLYSFCNATSLPWQNFAMIVLGLTLSGVTTCSVCARGELSVQL